jgi:signal transduction histidine kinase
VADDDPDRLPPGLAESPLATGVVDGSGRWLATNPALVALLGPDRPGLGAIVDEPADGLPDLLGTGGAVHLRVSTPACDAGEAVATPLADGRHLVQVVDRSEGALLAERLASATAAMARFTSRVSHDLQNPLGTAAGFTELILAAHPEGAVAEYAERAAASATRAREVLADLVAEARHALGRAAPDRVELVELVDEVRSDLAALVDARGATVGCDPDLPPVHSDHRTLRRILALLVDNAVTHHPGAATVRVTARASDGEIGILVEDDGPGVAAADRRRVLETGVALGPRAGHGLGLTTAAANARRIGASLRLEGTETGGARAVVVVPQRRAGDRRPVGATG